VREEEKGITRKGGSRRVALALAGVAIFGGMVAGVYFLARREPPPVPPMPRAAVPEEEVARALSELEQRTGAFTPDERERELVRIMERLNSAESGVAGAGKGRDEAKALMDEFKDRAAEVIAADEGRFLRLGELGAMEFHDALAGVLREARLRGLDAALADGGEKAARLRRAGGTFMRLAERGLFGRDGTMSASPLLPEVLFRRRWCALAGRPGAEGLSEAERKVSLDFVVAFGDPGDVMTRVRAVDELAALDPGYDADVARALVYHQGGQAQRAIQVLEKAAAARPGDAVVAGFLGFLTAPGADGK
jgi:hypothetical protein